MNQTVRPVRQLDKIILSYYYEGSATVELNQCGLHVSAQKLNEQLKATISKTDNIRKRNGKKDVKTDTKPCHEKI